MSGPAPASQVDRRLCGLLTRKVRWGLSWRGWAFLALTLATGIIVGLLRVHPFLAKVERLEASVLVVEGWVPGAVVQKLAEEFQRGGYSKVYSVGGPAGGFGPEAEDLDTYAFIAGKKLNRAGVPLDRIVMVPTRVQDRDRTYSSAVTLRRWLMERGEKIDRMNIGTQSVHGRRTQLLYQRAFGSETEIGVISIPNMWYNPARWWRYSEGVKEVISEGAAYVYARFIFSPENK